VQQDYIEKYFRSGYRRFMKRSINRKDHSQQHTVEERLKIIRFFDQYGVDATREAFNKSRSTIFLWKQKLKKSKGSIAALAPGDRTPIHKRKRAVHPFIENFIVSFRTDHPGSDKATITPLLIVACRSNGIKPVSESTVGRIIHDLKARGKLPNSNRVSINARTGDLVFRQQHKLRKKERRRDFRPQVPGDIVQMDTVSIFACGIKRYIFTAIDISTRFAFACAYRSNSSANGSDFLRKFVNVAPFSVARIQTDNGSEFEKYFEKACQNIGLQHFYNYPKHPQSNGCVERFNRTIQEQFVYSHIDYLDDTLEFNQKLMEYLIWYNTEKVHRSIGNIPPLRYYINNFLTPTKKSNMLWPLTIYSPARKYVP
jgi:transposase InsO family protein